MYGFDDSQHLLSVRQPGFLGHSESSTHVCHWFALLRQDRSNSFPGCVSFYSKIIVEVWHGWYRCGRHGLFESKEYGFSFFMSSKLPLFEKIGKRPSFNTVIFDEQPKKPRSSEMLVGRDQATIVAILFSSTFRP